MAKCGAGRYLLIGSILGILSCTLGCVITANNLGIKNSSEKFPIRTLSIQIHKDQPEDLFGQLREFSEKHNLEFHLSFYKDNESFLAELYGKNLEILVLSKPVSTTDLDINFYEKNPANPPSQEVVDELFIDLKAFISKIPNVTILEDK